MAHNNYYEIERSRRLSILEQDIKNNDLIFIDTCAVMDPFFPDFLSNVIPILIRENKQIIVLRTVLLELRKKLEQMRASSLAEDIKIEARAYMGLYALNKLIEYKLLCYDEKEDDIADHSFEDLFITLRREHKILLITQDKNLTANILSFNNNEAVRGKPISVKMINNWGFLEVRTPSGRQEHLDNRQRKATAYKPPVHVPQHKAQHIPQAHNPSVANNQAATKVIAQSESDAQSEEIATVQTLSELYEPKPTVKAKPAQKAAVKKGGFGFGQVFTASEANKQQGNTVTVSEDFVAVESIARPDIVAVTIKDGVTRILPRAFDGCTRLERVSIPRSVTAIDDTAFAKVKNAVIHCEKDSFAHRFAISKGIQFKLKD